MVGHVLIPVNGLFASLCHALVVAGIIEISVSSIEAKWRKRLAECVFLDDRGEKDGLVCCQVELRQVQIHVYSHDLVVAVEASVIYGDAIHDDLSHQCSVD